MRGIIENINNAGNIPESTQVVVAVPSLHLTTAADSLRSDVIVSAQDCGYNDDNGAYTGETSAKLLKDAGINWTITGHSERRAGFGYPGEPSAVVGKKTAVAIKNGMSVIACIGEQLRHREGGTTMDILSEQLAAIAAELTEADWQNMVIAYEPVWAIGTGKVATPQQAEETHSQIRDWISKNVSHEVADNVQIIYGGSVKASNCKGLITQPNIDGFLIGGAALLPEFADIMHCPETAVAEITSG